MKDATAAALSAASAAAAAAAAVSGGPAGEAAIAGRHEVRDGLVVNLSRLWRYGLVLSRSRDAAEDLVQATCVRALERAAQYAEGTRLDRWLLAIMHAIWIDEVRSRRIRVGRGFVDTGSDGVLVGDGAGEMETRLTASEVLRRVDALPEAQRVTVFLAYVEGLSYREVADVLHVPIGTVMSRLAGARSRLADMAEPQARPAQGSRGS